MCWPGFLWSKDSETKSEWLRARLNRFISREPKATHTGCPFLGYFFWASKRSNSRTYSLINYEAMQVLVCEKLFNQPKLKTPKEKSAIQSQSTVKNRLQSPLNSCLLARI
jgi:hypothetical protein